MENFEEYSNFLTNIKYPINYNRDRLKVNASDVHRGLALGIIQVRPSCRKNKDDKFRQCCALKWKKYQNVLDISTKLFNEYSPEPDFKWTTIQYNYNQVSKKHKDGNNVGESYIIGLGDYTGGRLKVWHNDKDEEPEYIDIKNNFYKFDGSKKYHESEEFEGTRLSLIYFNVL